MGEKKKQPEMLRDFILLFGSALHLAVRAGGMRRYTDGSMPNSSVSLVHCLCRKAAISSALLGGVGNKWANRCIQ